MVHKTKISPGFCVMMALMLVVVPIRWFSAMLIAASFHEFCHYITIRLFTGYKTGVRLYSYSARMDLPDLGRGQELLCAIAGPLGGLILFSFANIFPRLAICGLIQSLYNLLPVYPLDGGRALSCILAMYCSPPITGKILSAVSLLCKCLVIGICFLGWLCWGFEPLCLLLGILVTVRVK